MSNQPPTPPPLQPLPGDPSGYPASGGFFPGASGAGPIDYRHGSMAAGRWSAAAITSLIVGILGCVPWLTGFIAIITGIFAIRATRDPLVRGRGMAIAGIVLGIISVGLWTLAAGAGAWSFAASAPSRTLSHQFIGDLAAGNIAACTAESTGTVTPQQLQSAQTTIQSWGTITDVRVLSFNTRANLGSGTRCVITGLISCTQGQTPSAHTFQIQTVEQNGSWKVDGFVFR